MKLLLIFCLNFRLTIQQMGGGDSGGGGGGGGGSSDSGSFGSDSEGVGDCSESCWIPIIVIVSLIVLLIALRFLYKSGYLRCDCLKVKDNKQSLLKNFIYKENTSTREELIYGLQILQNCNWKMSYYQKAWNKIRLAERRFEINYNEEQNKYYIDINLRALDSLGDSTYLGHLKYSNNQWKIFMIKTYDDKIRSQQFGQYAILIYEGFTNQLPEGFKGRWYFHEASQSHGEWKWQCPQNTKL